MTNHSRMLGTSAVLATLIVLAPGAAPAGAADICTPANTCNVEWTILGGFYENGIESQFQTYGGQTTSTRVLSIALNRTGTAGEQVEFGWRQMADDTNFYWFIHAKIGSSTKETPNDFLHHISGLHTYRILYDAPSNQFRFTVDGSQYDYFPVPTGGWTAALPLMNLERHSDGDDFNVTPVLFRSMWYHGSTWHRWSELGAKCFIDDDDAWSGVWDAPNDAMQVVSPGSSTCGA